MKVKIGKNTTSLSREVVASHMANLITTRLIITGQEKNFKKTFVKYKELCLMFLKQNKKFVYAFGEDSWFDEFSNFEKQQYELFLQEVYFKFSDGSEWTIFINDLANLRLMVDDTIKDKSALLSNPVDLAVWAQNHLSWDQVKDYCILRKINTEESIYSNEWQTTKKQIFRYRYKNEIQE